MLTAYTDGGARFYDGVQSAGWGFYGVDESNNEYTGYGAAGYGTNNHVAEVLAAIKVLEFALEKGVEKLQMFLDSEYVILGMNKIHNGEMPATNKDWWLHLEELRNKILEKNIDVSFDWVKGHSGVEGNEKADILATRGVLMQRNANTVEPVDVYECTTSEPAKKEKEEKFDPLHPMITGREWFFKTNLEHTLPDGRHYFASLTYEKNKKEGSKDVKKNAGKVASDSHYCLLVSKGGLDILHTLKADFDKMVGTEQAPVLVNMDVIKKKDHWKEMNKNIANYIEYKTDMGVMPNGDLLGNVLRPPLLAYRLAEYFRTGIDLIDWFEKKDPRLTVHEVTDFFIKTDDKGKQEMTKNYGIADRSVIFQRVPLPDGREIQVQLTAGIDIPVRNQINAIVKQNVKEPVKVYLVIWDIFSKSYHCGTIITCADDVAVYYTGESTYRIID
jgi:ribonuclease HI